MEDWNGISKMVGFNSEREMLDNLYTVEGLSINDIAQKLGCGPVTVSQRLERYGIPKRGRGGANNSHKLTRLLFRMDQRRVFSTPDTELAATIGCSVSTVYKYRRSVVIGRRKWSTP